MTRASRVMPGFGKMNATGGEPPVACKIVFDGMPSFLMYDTVLVLSHFSVSLKSCVRRFVCPHSFPRACLLTFILTCRSEQG